MRLDDVWNLYRSTTPDQWNRIGPDGIGYHQFWHTSTGGANGRLDFAPVQHDLYAVCREDVALSVAWGYDEDEDPFDYKNRDSRKFDWAPEHWGRISMQLVDLFYNGVLVDRFRVLSGDGGRALLPLPHLKVRGQDFQNAVEYFLRQDVEDVRLLDELAGNTPSDIDMYVSMTKLQVVENVADLEEEPAE